MVDVGADVYGNLDKFCSGIFKVCVKCMSVAMYMWLPAEERKNIWPKLGLDPTFFIFSLLPAFLQVILDLHFCADWLPRIRARQPSGLDY